jgi:HK97 gp10 family phage protein
LSKSASKWKVKAIEVHNVHGLRRKLNVLPDHLREEVQKQMELALKATRSEMRRNLKEKFTMRSRTLWRSIAYKLDSDKLGGIVGAFDDGFYGHFLEFGTRKNKIKRRPWLRPAYRSQQRKFKRRIYRVMKRLGKQGAKL